MNEIKTQGTLLSQGQDGYDDQRSGYQLLDQHRPDLIVVAENSADVQAAVRHAAERGLRVAVQSSGHGLGAGLDGGVLISTRAMTGVRVDASAGTAWVEAGARSRDVLQATAPHGLAPLAGSSPGVGAVSYTLGGGIGLLSRRHGFAADHVRRFELVTMDGELRTVDAESDPELFWALRGGGGSFGIVTGMEIELLPITHLFGGGLHFDVAEVPDILETWRQWTTTLPDEMVTAVSMLVMPSFPGIPEHLRGKQLAQISVAYLGSASDGEQLVAPLRAAGPRVRETLQLFPVAEWGAIFAEPEQPHGYRSTNRLLTGLAPDALAQVTKLAGPSAETMCIVQFRHLGGALSREPQIPNAISHREAAYSLNLLTPVEPDQQTRARAFRDDAARLFADQALGTTLNFSFGALSPEEIKTAFTPDTYQRLRSLKQRLDPHHTLHSNHELA